MMIKITFALCLPCLSILVLWGCTAVKHSNDNLRNTDGVFMNNQDIQFKNTDELISTLREKYNTNDIAGVQNWVHKTFKPNTKITIARDVKNPTKIDSEQLYDRVIIRLDKNGNETNEYYLNPIHEDTFSSNLFLSVRLNFIENPFELLLFTK
jgi:hypothetical protein